MQLPAAVDVEDAEEYSVCEHSESGVVEIPVARWCLLAAEIERSIRLALIVERNTSWLVPSRVDMQPILNRNHIEIISHSNCRKSPIIRIGLFNYHCMDTNNL